MTISTRTRRLLALVVISALGACSSDGETTPTGPTYAEFLCQSGEVKCIGNAVATCGADQLSWSLNQCGATLRCATDGTCAARECTFPGQSKCKDYKTVNSCNELGTVLKATPCEGGTTCAAGTCLPAGCTEGETRCGWRAVAKCNASGTWSEVACDPDQICQDGACVAQACLPETTSCKDDMTALTCRLDASGYDETGCGESQQCYDAYGSCEVLLLNPPTDTPDAGSTDTGVDAGETGEEDAPPPVDTGPKAELEPLDLAELVVDGEKIVFSSNKSATYVEKDSDLRITMDKGLVKIEISLKPVEEFDVGLFSSATASDIEVVIFFHDGSELTGGAQYRYVSVDYEVELIKFQAKGGRVKGTFSGTFTDDGGLTTIPFTNGQFDVKRHD